MSSSTARTTTPPPTTTMPSSTTTNTTTATTNSTTTTTNFKAEAVLPLNSITALMKQSLPADAIVAVGSKELMRNCVVELLAFVTSEACDTAREENRTSLTGDDIIRAAAKLGFDDYIAPLTRYLELYRAANGSLPPPRAAADVSGSTVDDLRDDPLAPVTNEPLIVPSTDVAEFIDLPPPTFDDDDQ